MRLKLSFGLRIGLLYAGLGACWILVSRWLLALLTRDPARLLQLQTYNAWLFVLGSALVLTAVIDRELRRRRRAEVALRGSRLRDQRAAGRARLALSEAESARVQADTAGRAIRQQVDRLAALRSIDIAIAGSVDLRVTLSIILDQVTTRLGVDAATVLLLDPYTRTLSHAASRGFRTHGIEQSHQRLGEGYGGRVALEGQLLHISDLAQASDFLRAPLVEGEGFRTYVGVPLTIRGQLRGVMEVFHRDPLALDEDWLRFLEALAGQCGIAVEHVAMFDGLQRANIDLALAYDRTLEGWSRALELRDYETQGHSERVTRLTVRLADALGLHDDDKVHMRRGALLHDIGKMGIPDSILLKPAPLTEDEWQVMRRHPVYAHDLLAPIPYLRPALDIPYCHHERWDGNGYPRGLRGESIPIAARVFTVVDVWDALTHERPYRTSWPVPHVREYIASLAGNHLDPAIAKVFLALDVNAAA